MRQEFEDLHEMLEVATAGAYPEIPALSLKAERLGYVVFGRSDVLDSPESKFDRILSSYLDKDEDLLFKGEDDSADELFTSHKLYAAFSKMVKNLDATVSEIDADTQELPIEAVGDFQRLKYLKSVFEYYRLYLKAECAKYRKEFGDAVRRGLGKRIRQLRQQEGTTIQELADRVYVSRLELNRYELGLRTPPASTLIQLSKVLGVSVDWLLGVEKNESD